MICGASSERCGASTSAFRQAGEPLPMTDREEDVKIAVSPY
jgi:hypothetical protein